MTEIAITIDAAIKISGLTRNHIYRFLADGSLEGRKAGRRTLILGDSLRKCIENLPKYQPEGSSK